jgi:hypothetical protein
MAVRGVVVDGSDRPVSGAEVVLARDGDPAPARASTGADGRFLFAGLDGEAEYLVGARAPGFAAAMSGEVRPGRAEVRLVLRPGILLHGTVQDGEGRNCAGALVHAVILYPGLKKPIPGLEVRTDEEGRYRFVGVPAIPGEVQATWKGASSRAIPYQPMPEVRVDLSVETGPGISGTVRSADGRPLAGMSVVANPDDGKGATFGESGEDGAFDLRGLRPLPHRVRVHDPACRWREARFEGVIPPRAGLEATLLPDPDAPGTVAFRLLDAAGRPVPWARVIQYRAGEASAAGSGVDGPDDDGVFRSALIEQGRWRWVLRAGDEVVATEEFAVGPGVVSDLGTLRLAAGVEVRGRLLDESGRPLPEARVHAGDDPLPERGVPDAAGRFVLRGLPGPEGSVRVLLPRCEVLELPWRGGAGGRVDLGDVRLRPARGVLCGVVRSRSGSLPAGTKVRLVREGTIGRSPLDREMPPGSDGRFEFREVPAGPWRVGADSPDPDREGFSSGKAGPRVELREGENREVEIEID